MKIKLAMSMTSIPFVMISVFIILSLLLSSAYSDTQFDVEETQTFIVHVSKLDKPSVFPSHHHWYTSSLQSLPAHLSLSSHPHEHIVYTYSNALHGFAARLTPSQASHLRLQPGFLAIIPQGIQHLDTTHTPQFLGLSDKSGLWPASEYGDDMIIGMIDSGIWPESQSFNDSGITTPVPKKWKGICESGPDFSCNKKIIGARAFYKGFEQEKGKLNDTKSPRDIHGHGTHTASTAAGSVVKNAGLYGYGVGEAKGMATKARIAVYKVCWGVKDACLDADILAAIDQAVADGVDVISLSISSTEQSQYYEDSTAIGTFGAMSKGVLVSASAGNQGPDPLTVANVAPWIFTVGASTVDREFPCNVILGDGRVVNGVSFNCGKHSEKKPLVFGGDIGSRFCKQGELNPAAAAGKIVFCDEGNIAMTEKGNAVKIAGGVGVITVASVVVAKPHLVPGTAVAFKNAEEIFKYIRRHRKPTASFDFKGTVTGSSVTAPKISRLSSRGPNNLTPEILKPDIVAPGINILAAWTGAAGPAEIESDKRRVGFNMIFGTSMSCPHVSGLAAMLRKAYPNWSPSAIKSALMTTAYNVDNTGKTFTDLSTGKASNPFQHGAGHVDPNKALNPGLVYDIQPTDYLAFLCSIGYNQTQILLFTRDNKTVDCGSHKLVNGPGDLNYPSFSVVFKPPPHGGSVVKYRRVVTNVGVPGDAVYRVKINSPSSAEISVSPSVLKFTTSNQSLSYEITFKSLTNAEKNSNITKTQFGSIEWTDNIHVVRSPIAFMWPPT